MPRKLSKKFFADFSLRAPVGKFFAGNYLKAIEFVYPNTFSADQLINLKPKNKRSFYPLEVGESMSDYEVRLLLRKRFEGKSKQLPRGFWKCLGGKERLKIAIKMMLEEYLQWNISEIPKKVSWRQFRDYALDAPVKLFFNLYSEAIMFAYPDTFKPWEFR